ncbi:S8 family serine peptidase [Oculatella sp. LEGE 06141]|nr:S8 family serine peptidase [Oculatella sp. LEGE 06141]
MILQRGGEELILEKVPDRFTVRPTANRTLDHLTQQVGAVAVNPIASVDLVEIQVDPGVLEQMMQLARASGDVSFASHVYQLKGSPNAWFYLTDQLTVQFAKQIKPETARAIAQSFGLQAIQAVEGVSQAFVFRLSGQSPANPIKLANQLMRRPEILTAEPNIVTRTQPLYRPRDSEYGKQWYLNHAGGADLTANSHISAEAAWDITRGVRSVVVAVADDAIDLNHPDFQGKGKIVAPRDLKDQDFLPMPGSTQENHGTACAGLAIAEENGNGMVGVAPGCAFMPIRTSGFVDDRAIEQLFGWAIEKGASVISCSWGPSEVYFPLPLRQRAALTRAATQGRNGKGCVIIFAAGNANRPVNGSVNEQGWPNNVLRGPTNWLNGFAVHPDVITVAASTSLNQKAAYSNWGTDISVAAPSNNSLPGMWLQQTGYTNTAPTIRDSLRGRSVFTSDRVGAAGYESGNYTAGFGGTSSACPLVAGVAALMLSANPDLTAREVKQILQETTDKIVDSTPEPQFGLRKGTYDAKGHSQWFGYGKVNAARAVQAAQQRLAAVPRVSQWVRQQNTAAIAIPDDNPRGAVSSIQITNTSQIRDIQISLDINHSYLGDIEVVLMPPRGTTVLLQSRTLGRRTRLQTTYSLQTTPALRQCLNQAANGNWRLQVTDYAPLNTGTLTQWQLSIGIS